MKTFSAIFLDNPRRNVSFKVRGICQFDVLNPCWDNRPSDVVGQHWGSEAGNIIPACADCTKAAKSAISDKLKPFEKLIDGRTIKMLPVGMPFICEGELSCDIKVIDGNEQRHAVYSVDSILRANGGIAP